MLLVDSIANIACRAIVFNESCAMSSYMSSRIPYAALRLLDTHSPSSWNDRTLAAHRASFESAIDACILHPDGLQHAADLISRMKAVGHDLGSDHYNVLIRGFGDARNLGAALNVFQEMRDGVAVGGPGGGPKTRSLGWEVDEDMFAALLGACTRR